MRVDRLEHQIQQQNLSRIDRIGLVHQTGLDRPLPGNPHHGNAIAKPVPDDRPDIIHPQLRDIPPDMNIKLQEPHPNPPVKLTANGEIVGFILYLLVFVVLVLCHKNRVVKIEFQSNMASGVF